MGFSIPVIINSGLIESSLRHEAGKIGIPVITYEAGEALRLDERSIVTGVRGIVSVMRTLGMLPSRRISTVPAEPYIARSSSWFRAPLDGVFRPLVKLGTRVRAGDSLGVVSAPFSAAEEVLTAKNDGIIICVNNLPLVNEGDALFHIARFSRATAVEEEIAVHESNIEEDRLFEIESIQPEDSTSE
jgi:predicted deacylase